MTTAIAVNAIYNDISNVKKDASSIGIEDILDVMNEDILKDVINKALGHDEYDGDYYAAAMDRDLQVCSIRTDSILGQCLAQYIGAPAANEDGSISEKWANTLRGAYFQSQYDWVHDRVYFVHGVGYDWIDMDLLGGNGDGSKRREFEDGINFSVSFDK